MSKNIILIDGLKQIFTGDRGKEALAAFCVLVLVQLGLVIGLLVLGVKGTEEIGEGRKSGVPYYVGAFVVGGMFALPVLQIAAVIILSFCEEEYCITSCFMISSCILNFFGILACVLGMIFVIAFGIANCRNGPDTDYTDVGFCSYNANIDANYTVAVVALVLILFMLVSTCVSFYLFSKCSEALVSRKDDSLTTSSSVAPLGYEIRAQTTSQQGRTIAQPGPGPLEHHTPSAPPPRLYSDPAYPPNIGWQGTAGEAEEPPPSYESVLAGYTATSINVGTNHPGTQPRTSSVHSPSQQPLSLCEQMSRDTARRMREDRLRRQDEQRQRRIGVPQNRIVRKFIGRFGF